MPADTVELQAAKRKAGPIRQFVTITVGVDGPRCTFDASQTDIDYQIQDRKPCGKVTLEGDMVHVAEGKIDAIIEQGCSMLRHLPSEQLEAQLEQYKIGRDKLVAWNSARSGQPQNV